MPVTINGSGPIAGITSLNTTVSDTELGYLDGVTSAIQTQLGGKADTTGNGAWTSYTPTLGGITLGNGSLYAAYCQIGKIVHFRIGFNAGSTTSFSGSMSLTIPVAAANQQTDTFIGSGYAYDASPGTGQILVVYLATTAGNITINPRRYDTIVAYTSTVPWTWAVSDQLRLSGTYEAA